MQALLTIPGTQHACITDDTGRLLNSVGDHFHPSAAVLVLAHATLAAASELGRRSGSGDCIDLIQNHEGGHILLRSLPQRRVLLVFCLPGTDLTALRQAAARLSAGPAEAPSRPTAPVLDMASALHAMPDW